MCENENDETIIKRCKNVWKEKLSRYQNVFNHVLFLKKYTLKLVFKFWT